jgi:hypothetical protein
VDPLAAALKQPPAPRDAACGPPNVPHGRRNSRAIELRIIAIHASRRFEWPNRPNRNRGPPPPSLSHDGALVRSTSTPGSLRQWLGAVPAARIWAACHSLPLAGTIGAWRESGERRTALDRPVRVRSRRRWRDRSGAERPVPSRGRTASREEPG